MEELYMCIKKKLRSIAWLILIALLTNVVSVSGISAPMISKTSSLSNNLAISKNYLASSTFNSSMSGISKAADVNTNTWWRHMSTDLNPWWKVDLGSSLSFNRIVMKEYLRNGDYLIWKYKIEYSNDNSNWTMLDSEGDTGVDNVVIGSNKIVDFTRITARYVKFSILSKDPADVSGLSEFEIYNKSGTSSPVTVTVKNTINGKSPKYVGFSATRMAEGSNQPSWWKYSNANTVRWWITPERYVPDSAISTDIVSNVTDFNKLKATLRANPESSNYINWSTVNSRFTFYNDTSNGTLYTTDWTLQKYKDLGIEVMAQMHSGGWDDTWSNHWHNWKKIYATAFHVAKNYDVRIFQTPNEPDHPNAKSLYGYSNRLAQVIKIYSDACRSAVQDVNKLYNKSLKPIIVGPVLAGSSNSEYDTKMLQEIRKDYAGNTISYNNVDWYDRHRYSTTPLSFQSQISSIKSTMDKNLPSGVSRLPITYSEWNWSTNGNWANIKETSDSPTVFTDIAETWGLTMESGVKGMYLFKFSDGATINGNRVQYEYLFPKDPTENKAYKKPVTVSSQQKGYEGSKAVDNDISDASMWRSLASATAPQTLEIDLQGTYTLKSATIENGTDNGLLANTEVLAELRLQYWTGKKWLNIPGAVFNRGADPLMLINFTSPVTTSKVRLYTNTAGEVRIREIALSENYIVYDIGGPMKSFEIARLFAEGFKGERDLYTTTISGSSDSSNKAFTSYDPASNNYYIWLSRRSEIAESINLNLSALDVSKNSVVTVREVSERRFGEVVLERSIPDSKILKLGYQHSESLWLVTVPKGKAYITSNLNPTADAQVKIGKNINTNYGTASIMTVRQSNTATDDNSAAYIKFDTGSTNLSQVKQAILKVYGTKNSVRPTTPLAVNVYVVNNDTWTEGSITGNNAPNLNKNAAFVTDVGNTADIAGILTYVNEGEYAAVDVTKYVKEHPDGNITFALVREKRYPGLGEVKDTEYFTLDSKEGTNKPILEIRVKPTGTTTSSAVFTPSADAYVVDGSYEGVNYGKSENLVSKSGAIGDFNRRIYMKFDLRNATFSSVKSAKVKMYCNSRNGTSTVEVRQTSDSWNETDINWNNRTGLTPAINSNRIDKAGMYYEWDITSYVNSQLSGDKIISLGFLDSADTKKIARFNSREATSNKPVLEVIY
jgi:hypothetical protein